MSLPPPAPRRQLHARAVTYRGYLRDDGLWDIEGELADTKTYEFDLIERGRVEPGSPVHGMVVRATIDDDMIIRAIAADLHATPLTHCRSAEPPLQQMVGLAMGPGWRQAIERVLGGVKGCTHLRELLFNLATAAYQTIQPWREHRAGLPRDEQPYYMGRCIGWDTNGPVVARFYPQFAGAQPVKFTKKLAGAAETGTAHGTGSE